MIIVLTGAPVAGKATQADMLAKDRGWRKLSTGDALRKQVRLGTPVGQNAARYMNEGRLVPDEVLFEILKAELGEDGDEVLLLDGYPRNVEQAKALASLAGKHPVVAAIHLDVARDDLIERLSGRRTCSQCGASYHLSFSPPQKAERCDRCGAELISRADDEPAKIGVRLDVYEKETRPVIDFYKKKGLYHRLEGNAQVGTVFAKLAELVDRVLA